MCGRFTQEKQAVTIRIGDEELDLFWDTARYNVGPMQTSTVIVPDLARYVPKQMVWGLVPSWAKDVKIATSCINARSETVADKPAFRSAFKSRRCLVPVDGFFEWEKRGKVKVPWRFVRQDGKEILFAGLWESWKPPGTEVALETFTILTTTPNAVAEPVHDRMPVILDVAGAARWLQAKATKQELLALCVPAPDDLLRRYMVNPVVGNIRNQGPECVQPLA